MRRSFCMLLGMSHDDPAMLPSLPRQNLIACTYTLMLIWGGSCHAFVFDQSASAIRAVVMGKTAGLTAVAAVICVAVILLTLYLRD